MFLHSAGAATCRQPRRPRAYEIKRSRATCRSLAAINDGHIQAQPFSSRSPINGNLRVRGRLTCMNKLFEVIS